MNGPGKPTLTREQADAERAADERDTNAITRFFGHILGGKLRPSCRRASSSQRERRTKKPKGN